MSSRQTKPAWTYDQLDPIPSWSQARQLAHQLQSARWIARQAKAQARADRRARAKARKARAKGPSRTR